MYWDANVFFTISWSWIAQALLHWHRSRNSTGCILATGTIEVWKLWKRKNMRSIRNFNFCSIQQSRFEMSRYIISSYFISSIQKRMNSPIFTLNPWPLCYSLASTLLDTYQLPHVLFLSGSIHRPEVLRAKLSESNSQILQISAILTWPDSYVTFHKCCGHWWHDSRRHPKCCLRLGRFCQTLQTLQTNQTRSRHEEISSAKTDLWIPSYCQRRKYLRKSPWPIGRHLQRSSTVWHSRRCFETRIISAYAYFFNCI